MVRLTINGKALEVAENTTIMEAAKLAGSPVDVYKRQHGR